MARINKFRWRPGAGCIGRLGATWVLAMLALGGGDRASAQARGYLLYTQHCVECHTEQVHWRDGRRATDWTSLHKQVRRWQSVAQLDWDEEDIQNVARYLNTRFYDFRPPTEMGAMPVTTPNAPRRGATAAR